MLRNVGKSVNLFYSIPLLAAFGLKYNVLVNVRVVGQPMSSPPFAVVRLQSVEEGAANAANKLFYIDLRSTSGCTEVIRTLSQNPREFIEIRKIHKPSTTFSKVDKRTIDSCTRTEDFVNFFSGNKNSKTIEMGIELHIGSMFKVGGYYLQFS